MTDCACKETDNGSKKEIAGHTVRGKIWTSTHYKGSAKEDQTDLEIQTFEVEPAWVKVSYGLTINLGNYESARCDAGVTLPTYVEETEEAFKRAWAIAEAQVQSQTKGIK